MQENHEKLKIFLKNHLLSSRFNQELSLQRERTSIYSKLNRKNRGLSDSMKDDSMAEIVRFKWATISLSPHDFCLF